MANPRPIEGVLTLLPTSFDASGALDLVAVRRHIAFLENAGMHGIVVASSAGESYALDDVEFRKLAAAAREACKTTICIVNCSYQNTRDTISRIKYAESIGADCALVNPYHYVEARFDADTYYRYFELIAAATSKIGIMLYNDRRETKGLSISVSLYERLLADFDRVIASVEDVLNVSEGGLVEIAHVLAAYRDRVSMLTRSEADMFIGMALGARGCLATYGLAMPEVPLRLYENCRNRRWGEALADYRRLTRFPWKHGAVGVNLPGSPCAIFPGTFTTSMGNTHVITGQKVGTVFPGTVTICKAMCDAAGRGAGDPRLPMLPPSIAMQSFAKGWLADVAQTA